MPAPVLLACARPAGHHASSAKNRLPHTAAVLRIEMLRNATYRTTVWPLCECACHEEASFPVGMETTPTALLPPGFSMDCLSFSLRPHRPRTLRPELTSPAQFFFLFQVGLRGQRQFLRRSTHHKRVAARHQFPPAGSLIVNRQVFCIHAHGHFLALARLQPHLAPAHQPLRRLVRAGRQALHTLPQSPLRHAFPYSSQ